MKHSTNILPDDHRDYLSILGSAKPSKLSSFIALAVILGVAGALIFSIATFVWALGDLVIQGEMEDVLSVFSSDMALTGSVVLGFILLPIAYWWLRYIYRWQLLVRDQAKKGLLDESSLRDGMNIGQAHYEFSEAGVFVSLSLVEERYTWDAFCELKETERNFLLVNDSGTALIVPKRGAEGSASLSDLRSLIASQISVKA